MQRRAGVIVETAVGQNLSGQLFQQGPEFADPRGRSSQRGKLLANIAQSLLELVGALQQDQQRGDLLRLKGHTLDAQLRADFVSVFEAREIQAQNAPLRSSQALQV